MGHDDFSASNGWLESWLRRYKVKLAVLAGESAEVKQTDVDGWVQRLPQLTAGYAQADIYHADETGLYFRALPNRSMVIAGDQRRGIKTSKERVTVLLAVSAAGEKLKPLVIGKSLNPRCFRGVDKSLLPVTYRANKKAVLFQEWLDKINSQMKNKKKSIIMFVDNCAVHPAVKLSNVKVLFLPPNTTSRLQPCDAGIIAVFKALYRKSLVHHVLSEMDTASTATELAKQVDLRDAIHWVNLAWTSVADTTIQKFFSKCGFLDPPADCPDQSVLVPAEQAQYSDILGDVSWSAFVTMDTNTHVAHIPNPDFEQQLLARARGEPSPDSAADSDPDETDTTAPDVMSVKDALVQSKNYVALAMSLNNPGMLEAARTLQNQLQTVRLAQMSGQVQKSISDFFVL